MQLPFSFTLTNWSDPIQKRLLQLIRPLVVLFRDVQRIEGLLLVCSSFNGVARMLHLSKVGVEIEVVDGWIFCIVGEWRLFICTCRSSRCHTSGYDSSPSGRRLRRMRRMRRWRFHVVGSCCYFLFRRWWRFRHDENAVVDLSLFFKNEFMKKKIFGSVQRLLPRLPNKYKGNTIENKHKERMKLSI